MKSQIKTLRNKYGYFELESKPSSEELVHYYREKYYQEDKGTYAQSYSPEEIEYFKAKNQRVYWSFSKLSNHSFSGKRLLDVGCGEGFTLSFFYEKGWEVVGIDYSDFGCRNNNSEMLPFFKTGDINQRLNELVASGEKFDVIWLDNVLEHVLNPEEMLLRLRDLSGEMGVIVIEVPNDFNLIQNHSLTQGWIENEVWIAVPDHISYFNKAGLDNLCKATGWNSQIFLGDFPIDIFLMNEESRYFGHPGKGKAAHRARIEFDNLLQREKGIDSLAFYQGLAAAGLGRTITGVFLNQVGK